MEDPRFRFTPIDRATLRQEWIRHQDQKVRSGTPARAGIAGAYLPHFRLDVPHLPMRELSRSVPHCAAMVMAYHGLETNPGWLAALLRTDELAGTPGRRLQWLRAWGMKVDFPSDLQFYRDGTEELNARLGTARVRLVYAWEERWLRYVRAALDDGNPPILFVELGRLYPKWRGLPQPHAVVLIGGDGRRAWIHDPAREQAPIRVGLCTLMDALLPGEPLAAVLTPDAPGPDFLVDEPAWDASRPA